jgi:opacity protein-like surface antigen
MKKIILTFGLLVLLGTTHAQAFKIGENRASFGVGFGWVDKKVNNSNSTHFPSPNAIIERGILPFKNIGFFSIGAQFGLHYGHHNGVELSTQKKYNESWTSVYFVPRIALYFHELLVEEADDFPENIDLYGGVGIGFNFLSHNISLDVKDDTKFQLGYNIFLGGRYYFKKNMSAFAEIGYGLSFLNVGLTIRY